MSTFSAEAYPRGEEAPRQRTDDLALDGRESVAAEVFEGAAQGVLDGLPVVGVG